MEYINFPSVSNRYPLLLEPPDLRDDDQTVEEMVRADPTNPCNDIMYPSTVINLEKFKVVSGFVPDYLHCCLEGVAKQFTEYYLASKTDEEIEYLDDLINKIAVPEQISRETRPLCFRSDWKAREWENFILYYSLPILSIICSRKLLNH